MTALRERAEALANTLALVQSNQAVVRHIESTLRALVEEKIAQLGIRAIIHKQLEWVAAIYPLTIGEAKNSEGMTRLLEGIEYEIARAIREKGGMG